MKRLILFTVVTSIVAFSSCKKQYTCECDIKTTETNLFGGDPVVTESSVTTTKELKKKDAESWCSNQSSTVSFFFTTTQTTCKLK